jgi:hypothetical protein
MAMNPTLEMEKEVKEFWGKKVVNFKKKEEGLVKKK